ncbi:NYN domain-containing protein [Gemmatimonas sp.]|uniref:NYN domain-containing protein n=1 Tax=Gemmatimonas sp. TaxID=1962908 RepID=UPI003567948F
MSTRELSIPGTRRHHLYLVPERRVPRASHAPAGRTLHLLDLENLAGGPKVAQSELDAAVAMYREAAALSHHDLVVVAVNPALAVAAGRTCSGARVVVRGGPNGADEALLSVVADREWVAARFDRVVIGSGDGIFTELANDLRALGIAVGVIAQAVRVSSRLARAATFVRLFHSDHMLAGAA